MHPHELRPAFHRKERPGDGTDDAFCGIFHPGHRPDGRFARQSHQIRAPQLSKAFRRREQLEILFHGLTEPEPRIKADFSRFRPKTQKMRFLL